jgi:ABC-2 type transport system ATP-binding protein
MNEIEISDVSKSFKDQKVLKRVCVNFEKGKIHGIIGRNGSGKTMLFKCICGFVQFDEGEIIVRGQKIGKDVDIPKDIGIIIEMPGFLPNYSAYNNLKLLSSISKKATKNRIIEAIKLVGLDPANKKHVGKFSMGMRQRLGIAQAIMEDPSLLILDEPFNGLDQSGVEDMRKLLFNLKADGKTILIASHSKEDIGLLCDTVIRMDKGEVIALR